VDFSWPQNKSGKNLILAARAPMKGITAGNGEFAIK
jgi:hypothetical protein